MDPSAQFAENLRRLRAEGGLTQEALSASTKLDPGEISRLERGERNPQLRTMVRLSRGLGRPLTDLVAGIE